MLNTRNTGKHIQYMPMLASYDRNSNFWMGLRYFPSSLDRIAMMAASRNAVPATFGSSISSVFESDPFSSSAPPDAPEFAVAREVNCEGCRTWSSQTEFSDTGRSWRGTASTSMAYRITRPNKHNIRPSASAYVHDQNWARLPHKLKCHKNNI